MTDVIDSGRRSAAASPRPQAGFIRRALDSDLFYSFTRSRLVVFAAILTICMVAAAVLAPLIAPHNPYDLGSLNLLDSNLPPAWVKDGDPRFLLGTDDQGRDILSTILYGTRSSLAISVLAVLMATIIGVSLGLAAGYIGGYTDSAIMRIADVMLTFPAILIALMVNGVAQTIFKGKLAGGQFW